MSHTPITAGSPEFRRINRAMVFGGFSTFALLYCVQPLMPLLAGSMFCGGVLTLLAAFAQGYGQLLLLRALLGLLLGGMPALAMAYLSEEIAGPSLGHSMGLYIGGSAFGGMTGRLVASVISD